MAPSASSSSDPEESSSSCFEDGAGACDQFIICFGPIVEVDCLLDDDDDNGTCRDGGGRGGGGGGSGGDTLDSWSPSLMIALEGRCMKLFLLSDRSDQSVKLFVLPTEKMKKKMCIISQCNPKNQKRG